MDATHATGNPEAREARASPGFGRGMRDAWPLDPNVLYLNHGTVGVTPRRVLAAQQAIRDHIETRPSQFMLRELTSITVGMPRLKDRPRMRVAADQVAEFVGARGGDLVFVDNATTGANAVVRSFDWKPGDEALVTDLGYGGVVNAVRYATRERGASMRVVEMPYPPTPERVVEAIEAAIGPRTRMVVTDHIASESALLLPVAEIASRCRARSVPLLVDGAHAPGAIALDIPAIGAEWYVANLHKWAFAPRSSGILWVEAERQGEVHPTVISWGLDRGFTDEFDLPGTRDPSCHLAAPEGIAFQRELGLEALRSYNHGLAWRGAHFLAERWGTRFEVPESMVGTMATIPLPDRAGRDSEQAARLRDALLFEDAIEVQVHAWRGRVWVRISGQVYNDEDDLARLAEAVSRRI
ncbi:MAG TPA: aminotransferase class V-fold PLP-dependent enzyme [Candidatus Eisenbacteria bacterium]|nr:aminotransferase class V-fold PLP-dependent enzyme [Candidatus Eisenbacteria bacterium]